MVLPSPLAFAISLPFVTAFADAKPIHGSDTLQKVFSEAIEQADLRKELTFAGGGSRVGEAALVEGRQGIAPSSRALEDIAIAKAKGRGIEVVPHKLGIDGVGVFVNAANPTEWVDLKSLHGVFTCRLTRWEDVPGSRKRGPIHAVRRDDLSGTTDVFKAAVKINTFGACVAVFERTSDIAAITSLDPNAFSFSGLSAGTGKNKALPVAVDASAKAFPPTVANIRSFQYPLARYLFVYEAKGSLAPSVSEGALLSKVLDRRFMDPILLSNGFVTLD
jgi:phosphate transport system substrate-binding protein